MRLLYSSLLLAQILALTVQAQTSRSLEKEQAIWAQLHLVAPGAVEGFKQATELLDKQDYQQASNLYQQVVDAAPQFDPALRRLGFCLISLGDVENGVKLLEKAVQINHSAENLSSLAQHLAFPGKGTEPTREVRERALGLALEADQKNRNEDFSYPALVAELALRLDRKKEFREATLRLVLQYPDEMVTHYFSAIRAAIDEEWTAAEDEIKKAEQLGLAPEVVKEFLDSGIHSRATVWRYAHHTLYLVAAWCGGLLLLFILGKTLSTLTLRSIERKADPNATVTSREQVLRRTYGKLINLAGLYYYVSLPIVILLVVALAGSVIYGFLMLGRIPVKLTVMLVIGTLVTVFRMIESLFIKVKAEDPGRSLTRDEAPGVWTLTEQVASDVGTRPIDEIRITPGTEFAVYERGSRREKSQDKAQRILILGTGVLNGFRENPFRAVLAHEYGHFAHRDTAGGDVAMRVNSDIMKFAQAMIQSGQAVWWNLAFHFLRLYHFLFRRIGHGASRLQEVLADRMAALKYGAESFEEGLRHVIRRSVEFEHAAHREINEAVSSGRALQNLYDLRMERESSVEEEISKALSRRTSEDDTHPGPMDRFLLVRQVRSQATLATTGMVWDLFTNREDLTNEMSGWVNRQVSRSVT